MSKEKIKTNENIESNQDALVEELDPREVLIKEIKSIRFDSPIFEEFKEKENYFFGIDFTYDLCNFTIDWINSRARDTFIEMYKKEESVKK